MKEILPVIMNSSLQRLAVIDDYISLIWTSRYYTSGDFELCVDATAEYMSLLHRDYFVMRDDDENVGIIEDIIIQRNEDGHEMIIASGRFLDSILGRRIIATQTTVTGNISACIEALINQNVINPTIEARKIANFTIDSYTISTQMKAQYTGKNLLDTIADICETYGIGFKVTLNSNNQFVFRLYEGVDRTYDQSVNPWVIFSDEYDNLLSSEYEENYKTLATAALVAGEGEGINRKTVWVTSGTNLISNDSSYWESGSLVRGQNDDSTASLQLRVRLITGIPVQPNTSYVITKTAGTAIGIHQMTAEGGTFLHDSLWQTGTTYSFTTRPDCTFLRICLRYEPNADIAPADVGANIAMIMTTTDTGLNRYEVYKDQRQIRSNDGEISEAEYINLLQEAGKESLTKYTAAFTGTVYFDNITYKQDVNLGDLCVIENKRWGIYMNSRLVEVIESVSETGEYSIVPTFGV